jgi:tagatose 6-phosphate kinase
MKMSKVLTITVNPAIDKTYMVNRFEKGKIGRISKVLEIPGGKGLNVLRVLHQLGYPAMGTGFLGGHAGKWIMEQLNERSLPNDFYWISGQTRSTLTIHETETNHLTELLEPGPFINEEDAAEFLPFVERLSEDAEFVTISGSLTQGLPVDYYAKVVQCVRKSSARACVDTSGKALSHVLKSKPYLIKINDLEFADWLETKTVTEEQMINGMQKLRGFGCEMAVITCGKKGSYACSDEGVWFVTTPTIDTVNTVGSGDAFFAGLVGGLANALSLKEALKLASAAGASNAKHQGAGRIDPNEIPALLEQINVTKLL